MGGMTVPKKKNNTKETYTNRDANENSGTCLTPYRRFLPLPNDMKREGIGKERRRSQFRYNDLHPVSPAKGAHPCAGSSVLASPA